MRTCLKWYPLTKTEDEIMWVASKLSVDSGSLVVEAIELRDWLI